MKVFSIFSSIPTAATRWFLGILPRRFKLVLSSRVSITPRKSDLATVTGSAIGAPRTSCGPDLTGYGTGTLRTRIVLKRRSRPPTPSRITPGTKSRIIRVISRNSSMRSTLFPMCPPKARNWPRCAWKRLRRRILFIVQPGVYARSARASDSPSREEPRAGEYVATTAEHSGRQYPPYVYRRCGSPAHLQHEHHVHEVRRCLPAAANSSQAGHPRPANGDRDGPSRQVWPGQSQIPWGTPQGVSAWVRVVQKWAGPQYGAVFIPRPEHEVIMEFVDGDPDQPIITGCLYSAINMPPYTLPDNFTQSGVKTRSLTQGGDGGVGGIQRTAV